MNRFPDFGKDLQRGFEVDERCFDCTEFCHGCNARPENPASRCADYFPLPDVGVNGQAGQEIPPSRMGSRKDPRVRLPNGAPVRAQVQPKNLPARRRAQARSEPEPIEQDPPESSRSTAPEPGPATPPAIGAPRQQSPAGNPGLDGKRLCGCGAVLPKRKRCCEGCRLQRREATMRRRRERPPATIYDGSDVPLPAAGTLSTQHGSPAHN
jgi:hypothetical protein